MWVARSERFFTVWAPLNGAKRLNDVIFLLPFLRFSTSRQTLTCMPDTFFTALLSGRISSLRDDSGAIFIDRDPTLFGIILNYLRTRDIDIKQCDLRILRHEAEYYNISPLVKRLILCEDLNHSSCGDVWFYAHLTPPSKYSQHDLATIWCFLHSKKSIQIFFFSCSGARDVQCGPNIGRENDHKHANVCNGV